MIYSAQRTFRFFRAYIKSMRLYYSFVTGLVGWLGVSYYHYLAGHGDYGMEAPGLPRLLVILFLLFIAWGINQIINDYLGLAEDRVNAPQRPMVSGELSHGWALLLSGLLLAGGMLITALFLNPWALLPLTAGVLLNVLYEYAKAWGIWGNLVFGLSISCGTLYGFMACGPVPSQAFTRTWISVLALAVLNNAVMTYYTYFKDYEGDSEAGKHTLVVRLGLNRARKLAAVLGFLPGAAFFLLTGVGLIAVPLNPVFLFLISLTIFLQIWNGLNFSRHPHGASAYRHLEGNFRAYTCVFAAFIALFTPHIAMQVFIVTYIMVGFLFSLHKNPRA
ncbi:UbiA family prenyltransferase [Spirochaeta dissipatitropha]